MVEIVCTCPELARSLKESVQWQLLALYLERQGVSASIWVEGEEAPAFTHVPGLSGPKEAKSAQLVRELQRSASRQKTDRLKD